MRRRTVPQTHGMATLVAIGMMAVVAMAILSITALSALEARRTRRLDADAQLQQLLLSGTAVAQQRLTAGALPEAGQQIQVALPAELGQATLTIRVESITAAKAMLLMQANVEAHQRRQNLTLEKDARGWRITELAAW